jgi:hypothetical protein
MKFKLWLENKKLNPEDIEALGGLKFFHGGTKISGKTFDPVFFGLGEPGDLRPQGQAFYGANTKDHADIYQKYGEPGNQGTTEFRISDYALLYPRGHVWSKFSSEYTDRVKKALERATELLRERGLSKKSGRLSFEPGKEIDPMDLYVSSFWRGQREPAESDKIRQTLIDAGIDGSIEHLNDTFGNEIAIYNPEIMSRV